MNHARRCFLAGCSGVLMAPLAVPRASAEEADTLTPAIREVTGGAPLKTGRVTLEIPRIADNGNAVPLKVSVESAMTAQDHVRSIHLLSEKNPRTVMARFFLGPRAGKAQINTRVRLNGTQHIVAVAAMSDGSYWSGTAEVDVTESACYDATNP